MAIECAVITGILLTMSALFFIRKQKLWGLATLPLTLVPFTDVVMALLLVRFMHIGINIYWGIFALLCAIVVSCVWIGIVSMYIKSKQKRVSYIVIANLFNVMLVAILTSNILETVNNTAIVFD